MRSTVTSRVYLRKLSSNPFFSLLENLLWPVTFIWNWVTNRTDFRHLSQFISGFIMGSVFSLVLIFAVRNPDGTGLLEFADPSTLIKLMLFAFVYSLGVFVRYKMSQHWHCYPLMLILGYMNVMGILYGAVVCYVVYFLLVLRF